MNPIIRRWMDYYGKFYRTAMNGLLRRINTAGSPGDPAIVIGLTVILRFCDVSARFVIRRS